MYVRAVMERARLGTRDPLDTSRENDIERTSERASERADRAKWRKRADTHVAHKSAAVGHWVQVHTALLTKSEVLFTFFHITVHCKELTKLMLRNKRIC